MVLVRFLLGAGFLSGAAYAHWGMVPDKPVLAGILLFIGLVCWGLFEVASELGTPD